MIRQDDGKWPLEFFDNNGYNLNFDWNEKFGYWEGTIYLPKVSVGLYANTSIYVLQKVNGADIRNTVDSSIDVSREIDFSLFDNTYVFPMSSNNGDKITFKWDPLNKFVDEFFMFNFDEDYTLKETSALIYTPNDGPEANTLIVNRFDEYSINLDNQYSSKALPIHIAFMANEKYDATTYNRTLIMYHNKDIVAKIKFFAETVEEDERLKVWNDNLGYNITPEDTMIFYKSDIKEYRPDYILLNEKRKELMLEGSNIYPYIGSYKAIINAIKFFGYENLNIIEYWRNVNPKDENFGKIYHSSKYSLKHKETLRIGTRNITLPNKDYKKINALALVYSINKPTGEVDDWEIPKVKEKFTYTIEEALIKLFALRKKLNKEFMPGTSRIIDIIGEANYFGIQSIKKVHSSVHCEESVRDFHIDFDIYPKSYGHITDNTYFGRYMNIKENGQENTPFKNQMLSDIYDSVINTIPDSNNVMSTTLLNELYHLGNNEKCDLYKQYYQDVFVDYTVYKAIEDNDDYPYENDEYNYTEPRTRFSAKFVLTNTTFDPITFGECELKFSEYEDTDKLELNGATFGNIDTFLHPDKISWIIKMSDNQYDEDLKNIGVTKEYTKHGTDEFEITIINQDITDYNQLFVDLPYVGYYDVTLKLGYGPNSDFEQSRTIKKCLKVEPYQIELIGFYYDAREIPANLQYEKTDQMSNFIQESISKMHGWATAERTGTDIPHDQTMPYYSTEGDIINTGPYYNDNTAEEWYLADNITYEITDLKPLEKYTRYIKNGVNVKPYTWFLLGFEYSKIAGKVNPHWTITNNSTNDDPHYFDGKYLTLLLKKEGNYTVTLELEDKLGNKYQISRNIIVVSKAANYDIYQTFKRDYDYITEQDFLKELNEFYAYDKQEIE